jgi:hypothetical protein
MRGRWFASALLGGAVLSPLARDASWDSYPISSFPMFSRADLGIRASVDHAAFVGRDGRRRPVPPSLLGTPEPMVAKTVIERAIAEGRAPDLCARIAAAAPEDVATVEILTSLFDTQRYFSDPSPLSREVHASCKASR